MKGKILFYSGKTGWGVIIDRDKRHYFFTSRDVIKREREGDKPLDLIPGREVNFEFEPRVVMDEKKGGAKWQAYDIVVLKEGNK